MECKKTKFATEEQALFYIKKINTTSQRKKKPIRTYLCEKCYTWHLTSIEDKNAVVSIKEVEMLRSKLQTKSDEISRLELQINFLNEETKRLKRICDLNLTPKIAFLEKFIHAYQKQFRANVIFKKKHTSSRTQTVCLITKFGEFEGSADNNRDAKTNAAIMANRQINLLVDAY